MDAQPGLIKLALFGYPVRHSLSPRIHQAFARQLGLKIDYRPIAARLDEFPEKLDVFAEDGGVGCNITVPLKHAAWEQATQATQEARRAQAANTLVRDDPKGWFAANTDGIGLIRDLVRLGAWDPLPSRICVIGAGGAAAGILAPLLNRGKAPVSLVNRTVSRAQDLAEKHEDLGDVRAEPLARLPRLGSFDIVVHATSAGHEDDAPDLPESLFARGSLCYDLNYGPASAPLRAQCKSKGIRYSDGLGMLVGQAAESFRMWTGKQPECERVIGMLESDTAAGET